jgi:hypothetical protein
VTLSPAGSRLLLTAKELTRREEIETQLEGLRSKKNTLAENDYHKEIEPLMLELAKIYRSAEARKAASDSE